MHKVLNKNIFDTLKRNKLHTYCMLSNDRIHYVNKNIQEKNKKVSIDKRCMLSNHIIMK
jgi:hypothetical protein